MTSPPWHPESLAARLPFLRRRSLLAAGVRAFFTGRGYTEVETPYAVTAPGDEVHLQGFRTEQVTPAGERRALWLHTSPEFAMKRLLVGGAGRIFQLARVWRNGEGSDLHAPEFTMLEWYRAGEPYETLMVDCAVMLRLACRAAGGTALRWRGRQADPLLEPERLTVAEAFSRHAGLDLAALGELDAMVEAARAIGIRTAEDDTWSDVFSRILSERVEPQLGIGRATILCDYPISEAALARPRRQDPRVAERFELYACGVELANAFGELTDAAEQRRRFTADMREKQRIYDETYPVDEDFLAALAAMPEASGCALGFDRLVMLATGASHIDQVLWTPFPRPSEPS